MADLNVEYAEFHGESNYTIRRSAAHIEGLIPDGPVAWPQPYAGAIVRRPYEFYTSRFESSPHVEQG
jgi:hypothetical protein